MPQLTWPIAAALAACLFAAAFAFRGRLRRSETPGHGRRRSAWPAVFRQLLLAAPVRLWALILAGPPLTAFAWRLSAVVWRGPWGEARQAQQLDIIGWALWGTLGLIAVIVIALAAVKVSAETKLGSFKLEGDEDGPS